MALNYVDLPYQYYPDPTKGKPVYNGFVYLGIPNLDPVVLANRKAVTLRQQDGTEVPILPAAQPLRTGPGGTITYNGSSVEVLVDGNYSIKVLNSLRSQVYFAENVFDGIPITIGTSSFPIIFNTVADMVAGTLPDGSFINLTEGQYVRRKGYFTFDDAGGADHQIVADGTLTPDSGNFSITSATPVVQAQRTHDGAIDGKSYGMVGTGSPPNDSSGAFDNSVQIADFFLLGKGYSALERTDGVETRVPTLTLPGGTYYYTVPQQIYDYCNLQFHEDALFLFDDKDFPGEYGLRIGQPGINGGLLTFNNLNLYLFTTTAKGLDLINSRRAKYGNYYCQGKIIDGNPEGPMSARTNTALRIRTTDSLDSFFNIFESFESNHCHFGVVFEKGVVAPTQQIFGSFRFFGDSIFNDTSAIAWDSGDQGGADSRVNDGYIEAVGSDGNGFVLNNVSGFNGNGIVFDATSDNVAISFEGNSSFCQFRGGRLAPKNGVNFLTAPHLQNSVDGVNGPVSGMGNYSARQNNAGLSDGAGYISEPKVVIESAYTNINDINQMLQGGAYCPWNGAIYAASKEGNVIGVNLAGHTVSARITVGANPGDNDPFGLCYVPPLDDREPCIYWAARSIRSVVKISVRTNEVLQVLDLAVTAGGSCTPYGIAYCPLNDKVYVAHGTTDNVSIITPQGTTDDAVTQTLGGFADDVLAIAWCPVNDLMYAVGVGDNIYAITPTTTDSDSIAKTLASGTIAAAFSIAFCPFNRKMYVPNSAGANCHVIEPALVGADSVIDTITLTVGGVSSDLNRSIAWFPDAGSMMALSANSKIASIYPSIDGANDSCKQVLGTLGGDGLSLVYDPKTAKVAEFSAQTSVAEYA